MTTTICRGLLLGFLLLGAACGGDSTGPDRDDPTPPAAPPATQPPTQPPTTQPPGQTATPAVLPSLGLGSVPERFTSELWVHGSYAYTGSWADRNGVVGNALKVWNVSGNVPTLVDSVVIPNATTLSDLQVTEDGRLLVVSTERQPGSLVFFDLSNPASPRQIGRFSSANTQPGIHTAEIQRINGRLYAFCSVDPSPAQLVVVDITDPANAQEVLVRPMGRPFLHDVYVRNGILFTAEWDDGARIWDIGGAGRGGSPSNPIELGRAQTQRGDVHNLYWNGGRYLFVGEEGGPVTIGVRSFGDIHVVDVSDRANPREVAFFTVPDTASGNGRLAGTHNFSVDEQSGILYAAYYNGGVRALDIRGDLGTCSAEQKAPDGRCDLRKMGREVGRGLVGTNPQAYVWGVHFVNEALFASDMVNGIWKLDVSRLRRR